MGLAVLCSAVPDSVARAQDLPPGCREDAMIVFDASGSMAGNEKLGIATTVTRIDNVRKALAQVLPRVEHLRRIGLITYGPGPYNRCDNIALAFPPLPEAGSRILSVVNALVPAGRTPLTAAVAHAADVLDYRSKPGVIVLVTDGEETCGGSPCSLAKQLKAAAAQLTIHVIGYRMKEFSWTGGNASFEAQCLTRQTGGHYVGVETTEQLVAALHKTLGCPLLTELPPTKRSGEAQSVDAR